MHVFIDTNILLNFFHFSKDELDALIALGESKTLEFKSTARYDLKIEERLANIPANKVTEVRAQYDKDRTRDILKAVSAMLNTEGGELLIGVKDDGSGFGIHHDMPTWGKKRIAMVLNFG